jgi:NitT/TauT family transport system substrate-binding protein
VGTSDGSAQAIQLLISGDANFVQVVPAPLISALAQGADLVAVCTVITRENARIGVLPDSDITTMADLKGKTIGVASPTSSAVLFVRGAAAAAGLDPETDITIVPTGFGPASLLALQSGDVDALSYWTGYFADLEAATDVEFRLIADEASPRIPGPVIVTTRSIAEDQPEMVGRFLRAVAMSQEYGFANPEAAIRAFWELFPEDKDTTLSDEEALAASVFPLTVQIPDMEVQGRADTRWCWNDPEGWRQLKDRLVTSGAVEIAEGEDFDVSVAFTNDFIDAANDFDAEAIRQLAQSAE